MTNVNNSIPRLALIGVTGYGSIYWQYVRELLAAGSARLVAAVVINPGEAQDAVAEMKRHGTLIYPSYDAMFAAEAGKVDLCLIPTGIPWHTRMTVAALEAGMNVLVEKPLAGSLSDVHRIRDAERRANRWVAVGFQDMYCPEALWLKRVLLHGEIGRIRRVRLVGLWPRPVSYFARNAWAGKLAANGALVLDSPLNNAFAHFVNLCFFFAGPTIDSSADVQPTTANLWRAHTIETFDTGRVRGESSDGIFFDFFVSHACPLTREPEIRIEGTSGVAEWHHEGPVMVYPEGREPIARELPGNPVTRRSMFQAALGRIADPDVFICTSAMAEKHTAFIDALHRLGTIHDIAPAEIEWAPADGSDQVPAVRGIDEPFRNGAVPDFSGLAEVQRLVSADVFETFKKFEPACVARSPQAAFPADDH